MKHYLILFFGPLIAASGFSETPRTMKVTPLRIKETWKAPWEEVSGVKLHNESLYLASDSSPELGRYPLKGKMGDKDRKLDLGTGARPAVALNLGKKARKGKKNKKSQWEAITLDKPGRIFLLKETKDEIYVFGPDGNLLKQYELGAFEGRARKDKGFEGLALLKNSHFLLALTQPPVLVEFGPAKDKAIGVSEKTLLGTNDEFVLPEDGTLVPLHSWSLKGESSCEFSDLAVSEQKKVFGLLKDCGRIIEFPTLDVSSTEFRTDVSWALPAEVPHPEGLEILGLNMFLVTSDIKAVEKNVFLLDAPTP